MEASKESAHLKVIMPNISIHPARCPGSLDGCPYIEEVSLKSNSSSPPFLTNLVQQTSH